jgi:hypothetical protein
VNEREQRVRRLCAAIALSCVGLIALGSLVFPALGLR